MKERAAVNKNNLSKNWYYTQRNNQIRPKAACMPTARVMFYRGNEVAFENPSEFQDDDYFMSVLNSKQACALAKVKYPWSVASDGTVLYPPNEIHGMYHSWLDHKVCGRRVSDFYTDLTIDDYIEAIGRGEVIMTSGAFPMANLAGHAFCVIGWDGKFFRLADPWGDFRTDYVDQRGYDVPMSVDEFQTHVKPVNATYKWGHLLLSGVRK